jgi:hypothetical protein
VSLGNCLILNNNWLTKYDSVRLAGQLHRRHLDTGGLETKIGPVNLQAGIKLRRCMRIGDARGRAPSPERAYGLHGRALAALPEAVQRSERCCLPANQPTTRAFEPNDAEDESIKSANRPATHLHWSYATKAGNRLLNETKSGLTVCGAQAPRPELSIDIASVTCPRCEAKAKAAGAPIEMSGKAEGPGPRASRKGT